MITHKKVYESFVARVNKECVCAAESSFKQEMKLSAKKIFAKASLSNFERRATKKKKGICKRRFVLIKMLMAGVLQLVVPLINFFVLLFARVLNLIYSDNMLFLPIQ